MTFMRRPCLPHRPNWAFPAVWLLRLVLSFTNGSVTSGASRGCWDRRSRNPPRGSQPIRRRGSCCSRFQLYSDRDFLKFAGVGRIARNEEKNKNIARLRGFVYQI